MHTKHYKFWHAYNRSPDLDRMKYFCLCDYTASTIHSRSSSSYEGSHSMSSLCSLAISRVIAGAPLTGQTCCGCDLSSHSAHRFNFEALNTYDCMFHYIGLGFLMSTGIAMIGG